MTGWVLLLAGAVLLLPVSSRGRLTRRSWRLVGIPAVLRRRRRSATGEVVEVLAGLRDELRAGAALRPALERAVMAVDGGVLANTVAVSRMGGDVPAALRQDAHGRPLVLSLAALWQVCEGSGAALAAALDRLVEAAEQSAKVRREVTAQLAGPRSTVRVLAVLPVVGLGMGLLMGADPIGFLLGTPWGWGCLIVAAGLETAGVLWMRRLVSAIESQL